MQENRVEVLGRLIPDSGKVHQNQEVYNSFGGSICALKATDYKNLPKILLVDILENDDEQDNPIRKFKKRNSNI